MTLEEIEAALSDDAPDTPPAGLLEAIQDLEEPMASALESAYIVRFMDSGETITVDL